MKYVIVELCEKKFNIIFVVVSICFNKAVLVNFVTSWFLQVYVIIIKISLQHLLSNNILGSFFR